MNTPSNQNPPEPKNDGSDPSKSNEPGKPDDKSGAPDAYTEFKLPDGVKLDQSVLDSAIPIFKDLGLDQAGAQRLIDFHAAEMQKVANSGLDAIREMREGWQTAYKADPEIGHKLPQVKAEIGKAIDSLGDAKLAEDFREAMNLTGVGDNPAFIKTMYKFAQRLTEGSHVPGGKPSPHGQNPSGSAEKPTPAKALYPNLA